MISHSVFQRLLAILLAIAITLPSAAWADDAAAAAAEYYNQATIAYQQGDYQKAADLLDQAFGKNPDLVYKYNRILALQALGQVETALSELNTMFGPMKADAQNRFDDIDQIKSQLEAAVAAQQTNEPDPNDTANNTTDLNETAPTAPAEKGPNYLAIGLLGGGIAVLGTGLVFATGVLLPGDVKDCVGYGSSTANCDSLVRDFTVEDANGNDVPGTVADARDFADRVVNKHQIIAVSLLAGGAVLGAIGTVLLVLDSGEKGSAALQFMPTVGPDGVGAAMHLRF